MNSLHVLFTFLVCLPLLGCQSTAKPLSEQLPKEFKEISVPKDQLFEVERDGVNPLNLTLFPKGTKPNRIGGQKCTQARALDNGDVEVGAELKLNPAKQVKEVYVAVYSDQRPRSEYWTDRVDKILKEQKPIAITKAKFFVEDKRYLGLIKVAAQEVPWRGLWWAPDAAQSAYFIVSILVVGQENTMTRSLFSSVVIRPKKK